MGSIKGVKRGPYNKTLKGDTFTFLMYPESASDGWKEILMEMFPKVLISPLHDKDLKLDDGNPIVEFKKPHYHVIVSTSVTLKRDDFEKSVLTLGAVVPPLGACIVSDLKKMARYLIHKDDLDKARYNQLDVVSKNFDYNLFLSDRDVKVQLSGDILNLIFMEDITSLLQLVRVVYTKLTDLHYSEIKGNSFFYKTIIEDYRKSKGELRNE